MTTLDPNFRDLLACLNSAGVRYLVVGGYAVNFHGHHRNTADFDIWLAIDPANARRVSKALRAFGFAARTVPPSRFARKGPIHAFGRKPWRVDLLSEPSGVEFDACYARRVESDVDGLRIPWISLEDLITNKRASGRLKDLADVESLEEGTRSSPTTRKKKRGSGK